MCDTIVALGNSTLDGNVLFGKNSDREPNEAHEIIVIPAAQHEPGSQLKCTYITIPQVEETYRVLLAKPFWIWGAEMGTNEYGVTIGNEAVFTRTPYEKQPGLIGMDFLRLALERTRSAEAALQLIISLLEQYGQSGNCGFAHKFYYHNSYLICDPGEAWVLETSGKEWAARKVNDVGSISNAITITNNWDMASKNLVSNAVKNGWCRKPADFSFAHCYSEPIYTRFSDARRRQVCTLDHLREARGSLTAARFMSILRSHQHDDETGWSPARGVTGSDVCMHAGWGPARGSQTTGSMVSMLSHDHPPVHYLTGTSAPCTSLFKPVWLDAGMPGTGPRLNGTYDETTLFWLHERLHREILRDYATRIKVVHEKQQIFEQEMIEKVSAAQTIPAGPRYELSVSAFREAETIEAHWLTQVYEEQIQNRNSFLYNSAWNQLDREAKMLYS